MTHPADAAPTGPSPEAGRRPNAASVFRFSIEDRAAPALFVVGWLATIVAGGTLAVGLLAGQSDAGTILIISGGLGLAVGLVGLAGSQAVEARAGGTGRYRGPSPVLLFLAWIPTASIAGVAIALALGAVGLRPAGPTADLLYLVVQTAVAIGLVQLLVVGPGSLTWREIGFVRSVPAAAVDAGWGALLAGPTVLLVAFVGGVLVSITGVAPASPLPPTGTPGGLVQHLLAGALVAPIAEEILFRGVAVTAWSASVGPASAIVRSSLLFAAAHIVSVAGESFGPAFTLAVVGFLGRLPIALILGWTFVRRGSIWAPLGLHVTYNSFLIAAAEALAFG